MSGRRRSAVVADDRACDRREALGRRAVVADHADPVVVWSARGSTRSGARTGRGGGSKVAMQIATRGRGVRGRDVGRGDRDARELRDDHPAARQASAEAEHDVRARHRAHAGRAEAAAVARGVPERAQARRAAASRGRAPAEARRRPARARPASRSPRREAGPAHEQRRAAADGEPVRQRRVELHMEGRHSAPEVACAGWRPVPTRSSGVRSGVRSAPAIRRSGARCRPTRSWPRCTAASGSSTARPSTPRCRCCAWRG